MKYSCKKYLDNCLYFYFNNDMEKCIGHNYWNDNSLLFMNIPKCASTSIKEYLKSYLAQSKISQCKKKFSFIFLRHPMYRFKSTFKMKHKNLSGQLSDNEIIEKFMKFLKGEFIPYENYNDMLHFIPQHVFFNFFKIKWDFIGKVENINHDIEKINHILGVNEKIKKENRSIENKNFSLLLDSCIEKNATFIENFLKEDMLLYNNVMDNTTKI